tara:strand:+ start:258 stop:1130 length:873 start_codon:yes stop_codon:yes gene_type:complete
MNILLIGNKETCKSLIIKLIIKKFVEKNSKYSYEKLVFHYNTFDEINIQSEQNSLHDFCQNNINCNKIVYIDKIDLFSDLNQQNIKNYIDKYNTFRKKNKVFFILECIFEEKVRDIIKSRMNTFYLKPFQQKEYLEIFKQLLSNCNIGIHDDMLTKITSHPYITFSILKNMITKCELLNIKHITNKNSNDLCDFINYSNAEIYFDLLQDNKLKEAIIVLIEMYKNGTDISDIYFTLYEYIKFNNKINLYCVIQHICKYINEIYNGNYNKIMLVCLSYDINKTLIQNKTLI